MKINETKRRYVKIRQENSFTYHFHINVNVRMMSKQCGFMGGTGRNYWQGQDSRVCFLQHKSIQNYRATHKPHMYFAWYRKSGESIATFIPQFTHTHTLSWHWSRAVSVKQSHDRYFLNDLLLSRLTNVTKGTGLLGLQHVASEHKHWAHIQLNTHTYKQTQTHTHIHRHINNKINANAGVAQWNI